MSLYSVYILLHTYFVFPVNFFLVFIYSRGYLVPRGCIVISTPSRLLCLNVFFLGARCSGLFLSTRHFFFFVFFSATLVVFFIFLTM